VCPCLSVSLRVCVQKYQKVTYRTNFDESNFFGRLERGPKDQSVTFRWRSTIRIHTRFLGPPDPGIIKRYIIMFFYKHKNPRRTFAVFFLVYDTFVGNIVYIVLHDDIC